MSRFSLSRFSAHGTQDPTGTIQIRDPRRSSGLARTSFLLAVCFLALGAAHPALTAEADAATFIVNRTSDGPDTNLGDSFCDGSPQIGFQCTLRAAIQETNDTPGASDLIAFGIATAAKTIRPTTELPTITEGVTIDGYTQSGAQVNTLNKGTNAVLKIELDGSNAPPDSSTVGVNGLVVSGASTTIRGLAINRFQQSSNIDDGHGIFVTGVGNRDNVIEGNFIGTDVAGTQDLGNAGFGVLLSGSEADRHLVGGPDRADRNLISGNGRDGVAAISSQNTVQGNLIGTDKAGTANLGNGDSGVQVFGSGNVISANTIAFSGSDGVTVSGLLSTGNRITTNSIFSNAGLGIDLLPDGPTPNDPSDIDSGPNTLQNKPKLTSAVTSGGGTDVDGTLNSTPSKSFTVRFFSNPSGNEGKRFIGQQVVATNASGNAVLSFSPANDVPVGQTVTATAQGPGGNTSEFSAAKVVASS